MKHFYSARSMASWLLLLAVALCALPSHVAAQVSFRDDFDYPAGNLYKQGGWVRYGTNSADPIQVENKALTYAGYYENAAGKSVKLGDTASGEDLHAPFTDNEDGIKSGNLYCSALINVQKQPKGNVCVLAFEPRTNKSVIADGTNPLELGRLFLGESDNEGDVKIGIERGAKTISSLRRRLLSLARLISWSCATRLMLSPRGPTMCISTSTLQASRLNPIPRVLSSTA